MQPSRSTAKPSIHPFLPVLILAIVAALAPPASASVQSYVENFTTTQYKDDANTTAIWDTVTGELRLAPFVPALAGSTDAAKATRVCIAGNYAYMNAQGLAVLDISDPVNPTLVGSVTTAGSTYDLDVQGQYAYAAVGNGIRVFDISNPATPVAVGLAAGTALGVSVDGNYAYAAGNANGLLVFDVTNPVAPSLAGGFAAQQGIWELDVVGDYAYLVGLLGLYVVDITDPTAPDSVGAYAVPAGARYVDVDGDFAYLAVSGGGLMVIDISDPTAPIFAGISTPPNNPQSIHVSGDRAWVADHTSGIHEFDISNPAAPTLLHSLNFGPISNVVVEGEYVFAAGHLFGLAAVDARGAVSPVLVSSSAAPIDARDVDVSGNYAYVADGSNGVRVLDVSDPFAPTLAGTYDTPSFAGAIQVVGDLACVADSSDLILLDVSDPTTPTLMGSYTTSGIAEELHVVGNYAYIADVFNLMVVNITDPSVPIAVGSYPSVGGVRDVQVEGDYAFIADGTTGFLVLDVTNPPAPVLAGSLALSGTQFGVYVSGDHAFLVGTSGSMRVVDISDPTTPVLVGSVGAGAFGGDVFVEGDFAFVASFTSGVFMIDISDPTVPVVVNNTAASGADDALAWGEYLLVPRRTSGFDVYQVFNSEFHADNNVCQSLNVSPFSDVILSARVTATQTSGVTWELTADAGQSWESFPSDGSWTHFVNYDQSGLRWRSIHGFSAPGVNPTVSSLRIDWRYEFPVIVTAADIPNDQGGQVLLEWNPSGYDEYDLRTITHYSAWRALNPAPGVAPEGMAVSARKSSPATPVPAAELITPADVVEDFAGPGIRIDASGFYWEWLGNVPAQYFSGYAFSAATYYDQTATVSAKHYFQIVAHTADQWTFYTSYPDSGHSVDNLAPGVPQGVAAAYNTGSGNALSWEENTEPDLQLYRVYRSTDPDFVPGPGNLVGETIDVNWNDTEYDGWDVNYKISAVDHAGNEGPAASPTTATAVRTPADPREFALYPNVPNPFNPTTTIRYDVPPGATSVQLVVYDVVGRRIRTLVDGVEPPGARAVTWEGRDDAGRFVASGVYFYRLRAGSTTLTRRMVLLK